MKAQLALACVVVVIYASVALCDAADFRQLMQQCMSETQATEADLREFLASGMKSDAKENLKCYTKCLMEKQGHMSNGAFNAQATLDTLKNVPQFKDNIDEITSGVESCKDQKGANDCDTAFKISMCLKEHKATMHH